MCEQRPTSLQPASKCQAGGPGFQAPMASARAVTTQGRSVQGHPGSAQVGREPGRRHATAHAVYSRPLALATIRFAYALSRIVEGEPMLSLAECRALLGKDGERISDGDLARLRLEICALAEIILDVAVTHCSRSDSASAGPQPGSPGGESAEPEEGPTQ